jgi:hypothetical protein
VVGPCASQIVHSEVGNDASDEHRY